MVERCFRNGDLVGPDYVCSSCGRGNRRLWRETNTFLNHIDLQCADCAEKSEADAIRRYADFHQPWEATIGNLVPARPTPEGDTFWGHTSGDVEWWYALPQYDDPLRDLERVRIERDHFVVRQQQLLRRWLDQPTI